MLKLIAPLLAALTIAGGLLVPNAAQAAVTADIGGISRPAAPRTAAWTWDISYDDTTRNVTATATGSGLVRRARSGHQLDQPHRGVRTAGWLATSQNPDIAADAC
jgi:hypothetical protein